MKMEWNKVIYADCMNEENGLPTLPDKSIDLCLTDPPYNVDFNNKGAGKKKTKRKKNTIYLEQYNDNIINYKEWCIFWFTQIMRISKRMIFTPGSNINNLIMWFNIARPEGMFIHYKNNSPSCSSLALSNRYDVILLYGKFNHQFDFRCNVFDIPVSWGFLRKDIIHPHPKEYELYFTIINRMKKIHNIQSVIDPFLGSGTTAEVCTKLGIPWIGYEIMKEYSVDINKRLKNCKKEPQQVSLEEFK